MSFPTECGRIIRSHEDREMNPAAEIRTTRIDIPAPGFLEDWTPAIERALQAKHPGAKIAFEPRAVGSAAVRNPATGLDEQILEVEVKWTAA
jgi:hypothetical protein